MVVKRFLSVLLPPFEYVQTTIIAKVENEKFIAKGKVIIFKGWKKLYDKVEEEVNEEDIKEQVLPQLNKGDKFVIEKVH